MDNPPSGVIGPNTLLAPPSFDNINPNIVPENTTAPPVIIIDATLYRLIPMTNVGWKETANRATLL